MVCASHRRNDDDVYLKDPSLRILKTNRARGHQSRSGGAADDDA
jgi:hypothetical protein